MIGAIERLIQLYVYRTRMVSLGDVKRSAATLFAQGQHLAALRLYDAIVAAAPLDYDARIRVADCALALGDPRAANVYRATAWYCLKAGHPLAALVCARVLEAHGADRERSSLASLVVTYGSESEQLGKVAARDRAAAPRRCRSPVPDVRLRRAARCGRDRARARRARDRQLQGLSRGAAPDPAAVGAVGGRVPARARHARAAPAAGRRARRSARASRATRSSSSPAAQLRVFATDGLGRQTELAQLGEGAVFGEMALLVGAAALGERRLPRPRSICSRSGASRSPTLADELGAVAEALHGFTRERLLGNLMATSRAVQAVQPDAAARSAAPVHEPRRRAGHGRDQRRRRGPRPVRRAVGRARCLAPRVGWPDRAARRPQDRRRVRRDVARAKRAHDRDRRSRSARRPCCSSRASTSRASSRACPKSGAISKRWPKIARSITSSCSARTRLRPTSAS